MALSAAERQVTYRQRKYAKLELLAELVMANYMASYYATSGFIERS